MTVQLESSRLTQPAKGAQAPLMAGADQLAE